MDRYRIPEAIERHNENHDDKLNSTKLAERINYKNFTLETKKS